MSHSKHFWQRHEYLSIGLAWAIVVLALFREALLAGPDHVIGGNDVAYAYLPWLRFTVESAQRGIFPLWNPHVFAGTPFAGNPQTGLFYPATWLALWVGPERAFGLSIALHVWIAALGAYGWLRQIGATRAGALFASIAYALSGVPSARIWAGHYGPLLEAAWLPMLLWLATRALQRRSIAWAIVAGAPFGLMILSGHTPTFVLLALGAGVVLLFEGVLITAKDAESAKNSKPFASFAPYAVKSLGLLVVMAVAGVALAAVQILPALTFVQHSARLANLSIEFTSRFSLPPSHLLSLLVPDFYGEPIHAGYWSAPVFEEYVYYIGVPTLILAALSIFTRDARARFLVAFGIFGLIVALGPGGGAYTLLYRGVPFFDLLRAPARAGMWTMFSFAAAAGLCVSALQRSSSEEARRVLSKWSRKPIAVGIGAGLLLAGVTYALFRLVPSAPESGWMRELSRDFLAFGLLFAATSLLLWLWATRTGRAGMWATVLSALLLIDLGAYYLNLVRVVPVTRGAAYAAAGRALGDRLKDNRLIWVYANLFELNLGMDFGQHNVYGYDSLITARLQAFVDRARELSTPIYDLLNVRYVISSSPLAEGVSPIGESDGFLLYERPNAAPRAWIVHAVESVADEAAALDRVAADFDPQSVAVVVGEAPCTVGEQTGADSVSIVRYEPNQIEAQADAGAAGMLVFSEIDYPGWIASIDGAPAEIHRVDYGLRGVCLRGGAHTVVMSYDPPELKVGAAVSALTVILVAVAGLALARRNYHQDTRTRN